MGLFDSSERYLLRLKSNVADRGWWSHPGAGEGIAKHDAILSISGLNSTLELNIDVRIVPVMITLIMSLLKHF